MATSTTGSTVLLPLSHAVQLPIDQVNFVACQLFALLAAIWFRTYLHSSKTSSLIRHVVATLLGLYLALFCFGCSSGNIDKSQSAVLDARRRLNLISESLTECRLELNKQRRRHDVWCTSMCSAIYSECMTDYGYCFVFALGYLALCQIARVYIFDYGQYCADFSGPMMIITQKITSLAFEIRDGIFCKEETLTPSQRRLAVRRMPSPLEYLSYCCNFMGILAGPLCSYKDYIAFIEGRSYQVKEAEVNGKEDLKYDHKEPSPNTVVVHKIVVCAISLGFYMTATRILPVEYNIDERFQETSSVPTRVIYLYLSLMAARPKYYFAWTLADAINNAAGFGFQGYDKNGDGNWDLVSNLNIKNIEFSTSFKMFIDNWNIQTALWLKRVCYERATYSPTAQTFLLSAAWHGVYPGYYLTFFTGSLMTLAARNIRSNVRHHFLQSPELKLIYDVMTWIATQVAISYTVAPFVLLSVKPSLQFYSSCYYCLHVLCILVLLLLPPRARKKERTEKKSIAPPLEKAHKEEDNSEHNSHATTNNNSSQREETAWRRPSAPQ